jgi:hypothetical protein
MKTIFCLLALAATVTVRAQTSEALLSYRLNDVGYTRTTTGWSFQPLTNITVTALGAFQYVVTTVSNVEVGIWDENGALLASNTVTTNSPLVNQSMYEPITPVSLTAGQNYYLGAFGGVIIIDAYEPGAQYDAGPVTMAPEIQLGEAIGETNADFEFPNVSLGDPGSAIFVPNFEYGITPVVIVPPDLVIVSSGPDSLNILWPASGNFTLLQNTNLTNGTWMTNTSVITTINGTNSVVITPSGGSMFFRLSYP